MDTYSCSWMRQAIISHGREYLPMPLGVHMRLQRPKIYAYAAMDNTHCIRDLAFTGLWDRHFVDTQLFRHGHHPVDLVSNSPQYSPLRNVEQRPPLSVLGSDFAGR